MINSNAKAPWPITRSQWVTKTPTTTLVPVPRRKTFRAIKSIALQIWRNPNISVRIRTNRSKLPASFNPRTSPLPRFPPIIKNSQLLLTIKRTLQANIIPVTGMAHLIKELQSQANTKHQIIGHRSLKVNSIWLILFLKGLSMGPRDNHRRSLWINPLTIRKVSRSNIW